MARAKPVFVDVGSFERLREGEPWAGYRQFCTLVLYPLLLQAYKGVPFQPWLRGSLEGIEPAEMRALIGFRDRFRRGVLTNVVLHARLEDRYADREVKGDLKKAGFHAELIRANARKLRKLVQRLEWTPGRTAWSGLRRRQPLRRGRRGRQGGLRPRGGGARRRRSLLWDLGCNDGRYTRIAAATPSTRSPWTPTPPSSRPSTAALRAEGSTPSSRSSGTWPTPPPASAGAARSAGRSPSAAGRS